MSEAPPASGVERTRLAGDYEIPRIVIGAWQWSEGHRAERLDEEALFASLDRMVDAGFDSFDCADIYTGVEALLGRFVRRRRQRYGAEGGVRVHTKFVPDLDALSRLDRYYVERVIDRSLRRLAVERLDLVQFAWWDYDVGSYVEAARWLSGLQQAGKIRLIGATNFDVPRLRELVDSGCDLVSHQVQYSVLDSRPEKGMSDFCAKKGISLLCYGTLAGGFLTNRYLGAEQPSSPLANRSLTKYKLVIDEFGGWAAYQDVLQMLNDIATKHRVSIATVAIRYILERPQVAAAILGAGTGAHLHDTLAALALRLDAEDVERVTAIVSTAPGPSGDVYSMERAPESAHAAIMKYNLNAAAD